MSSSGGLIGAIVMLFIAIILVAVFFPIIATINFGLAILFVIVAILAIFGFVIALIRGSG